jgi:transitional endoplasmic reticulum ATPase
MRRLDLKEPTGDLTPLVRLWCLRALVSPAGRIKLSDRLWIDDALAELLGVEQENAPDSPKAIRAFLAERLRQAEACAPSPTGLLSENLRTLGEQLELTLLDREVLALLVLSRLEEPLHDVLELAGRLTDPRFERLVATVLARPLDRVIEALAPGGRLAATHLAVRARTVGTFEDKFTLNDELPHALTRRNGSLDELISFAAVRAGPAELSLADYRHLTAHLEILLPYLRRAVEERREGVNVLLHGGAGNGKTELAKALARELDLRLYEVRSADDDGDPAKPEERIASFTLMQAVLRRQQHAAILFDEIEDILPQELELPGFEIRQSSRKKAWFNRMLEANPVPTIWIANSLTAMDPAFLRRFDYVIGLGPPPRSARERMLRAHLGSLPVSKEWLARKAEERTLAPGVLTKLARVLEVARPEDPEVLEARFDLMARERLAAQGETPVANRYPYPERYRPEVLNASADPLAIAARVRKRGKGTLLLYGPPGTGKTGYAHFLARHLDRPLLVRRASDLLSMWVGMTEKLIREMFHEAAAEHGVLLLDEADSFLQDRREAHHSWEITQVNELLTHMEAFEGIFICATNFAEQLDPAAMRRFAVKVRFDPLRREQARLLFADTLAALQIGLPGDLDQERLWRELDALTGLTPGDFRAARAALELAGFPVSAQGLIEALRAELAARPHARRRPIGFAA